MLNLLTKEIFVARDAKFIESVFPMNDQTEKNYMLPIAAPMAQQMTSPPAYDDDDEIVADIQPIAPGVLDDHSAPTEPVLRRSTRPHKQPQWLNAYAHSATSSAHISQVADISVDASFSCFMSSLTQMEDPLHFKQVVKEKHWIQAMNLKLWNQIIHGILLLFLLARKQ